MDPEMVTRTIQLIIAPVVMITSCCILTTGLLAHYSSIGERLHEMVRERAQLLRGAGAGERSELVADQRLQDIDEQLPSLLRHHWLMRTSLGGVFSAIAFFIVDMFIIAITVISNPLGLSGAILIVFLSGVISLLAGVIAALLDIHLSHKIHSFEMRHILSLDGKTSHHSM